MPDTDPQDTTEVLVGVACNARRQRDEAHVAAVEAQRLADQKDQESLRFADDAVASSRRLMAMAQADLDSDFEVRARLQELINPADEPVVGPPVPPTPLLPPLPPQQAPEPAPQPAPVAQPTPQYVPVAQPPVYYVPQQVVQQPVQVVQSDDSRRNAKIAIIVASIVAVLLVIVLVICLVVRWKANSSYNTNSYMNRTSTPAAVSAPAAPVEDQSGGVLSKGVIYAGY